MSDRPPDGDVTEKVRWKKRADLTPIMHCMEKKARGYEHGVFKKREEVDSRVLRRRN